MLTGTKRYNELTRNVAGISAKVMTENLRELEEDGVIARKVYPEVPPRVEYSLSEKGRDLEGIINAMKEYGLKYKERKE